MIDDKIEIIISLDIKQTLIFDGQKKICNIQVSAAVNIRIFKIEEAIYYIS